MELKGKTAIVTGASSGIGAEFSKSLVDKGVTVYGLARRKNKLDEVKQHLGDQFIPVELDVSNRGDVEQWVDKTFDSSSTVDILINNAGFGKFGNIDELPVEDWEGMLNTNLSGIFYLTRLIVPMMKSNPEVCHIVNIASVAGLIGNPQIAAYNASKFGVRGMSEGLMKELRPHGIKVTCFYPGSIDTEFFSHSGGSTHPNMMSGTDVANTLIYVLETPDNFLIDELVMRPLNPKPPEK